MSVEKFHVSDLACTPNGNVRFRIVPFDIDVEHLAEYIAEAVKE